jgi:hypothetical protein
MGSYDAQGALPRYFSHACYPESLAQAQAVRAVDVGLLRATRSVHHTWNCATRQAFSFSLFLPSLYAVLSKELHVLR